jgi:hypothetical protein
VFLSSAFMRMSKKVEKRIVLIYWNFTDTLYLNYKTTTKYNIYMQLIQ